MPKQGPCSMDIHGYPWISTYIHGFACSRSRRTFPGQLFDRRTICLAQPHALTKATRRPQTPPSTIMRLPIFSIKHCTCCGEYWLIGGQPRHRGRPARWTSNRYPLPMGRRPRTISKWPEFYWLL